MGRGADQFLDNLIVDVCNWVVGGWSAFALEATLVASPVLVAAFGSPMAGIGVGKQPFERTGQSLQNLSMAASKASEKTPTKSTCSMSDVPSTYSI